MSVTAAQLTVRVDADTRDAESGISRVGSALGSIGKIAAGVELGRIFEGVGKGAFSLAQAAADDAASVAQLQQAVENSGASWGAYSKQIDAAITSGQHAAFTDDQVRGALQTLTQETGNAGEALHRLHTAEDLARGTGMDLTTASKLLGKATDENVNVLKRYGISIEKGASAQELLNKVDARFGGQSAKYAATTAGQWFIAKDALSEAGESLGYILLPAFTKFATFTAQVAVPALAAFINTVGPSLSAGVETAVGVVTRLVGLLQGPFVSAFQSVAAVVGPAFVFVRGFFDYLRTGSVASMNVMQAALNKVFGGETATSIVAWATLIGDKLRSAFVIARDSILTFAQAIQGKWTDDRRILGLHRTIGNLALTLRGLATTVVPPLVKAFDFLRDNWQTIVRVGKDILAVITPFNSLISGFLRNLAAGESPLKAFTDSLGTLASHFADLGRLILDAISKVDWSQVGQTILSGIGGALSDVSSIASSVDWGALASGIGTALGSIDWSGVAGVVMSGISGALSTIGNVATSIDWSSVASSMLTALSAAFGTVTGIAWDAAGTIANWISGVQWVTLATTILTYIRDGFYTVAGLTWDAAASIGTWIAAVDWTALATTILTGVRDAFYTAAGLVWDAGATLVGWLATQDWSGIASFILAHIRDGFALVTGVVWDAASTILTWIQGVDWSAVASTIATGIANGISTLPNIASGIIASITKQDYTAVGAQVGQQISTGIEQGTQTGGSAPDSKSFWQRFIPDAAPYLDPITEDIKKHADSIVESMDRIAEHIGNIAPPKAQWGQAFDVIAKGLAAIALGATALGLAFVDSLLTIGDYIGRFVAGSLDQLSRGWQNAQNDAQALADWFSSTFGPSWDAMKGVIDEFVSGAEKAISGLSPSFHGSLDGLPGDVSGIFSSMAASVGNVLSGLVGVMPGFGGEIMGGLAGALSDGIGTVEGAISGVVAAIISPFANAGSWLYGAGQAVVQGFIDGLSSMFGSVIGKLGELTSLIPIHKGPPEKDAVLLFDNGKLIIQGLIDGMDSKTPDLIKKLADTTTSIVGAFKAILDLGTQLKTATFPGIEQISQLKFLAEHAVKSIADSAALFSGDGLKAAKDFADTGKAIFDLFGSVLTAFADPKKMSLPSFEQVSALKFLVEHAVRSIADSAAMFTGETLTNAKAFADAANVIVGMLKDAVDAFTAIAGFDPTRDVDNGMLAIELFVGNLTIELASWAKAISSDVQDAAVRFANGVKDVVGWITDAVDGFTALAAFDPTKDVDDAMLTLELFVSNLIIELDQWAKAVNTDVRASAVQFGTAVSAAVGWITDAIDAFNGLAAFDPSKDIDEATLTLQLFVGNLIIELGQWADAINTDVRAKADALGAAFTDAVGWITDAIGAFDALAKFDATPDVDAAMLTIELFVSNLIIELGKWAMFVNTDVRAAADDFGKSVGDAVGWITNAVDAFNALATFDYKPTVDAALSTLIAFASYVIQQIGVARGTWTDKALAAATGYAQAISDVVKFISDAVNAFDALAKFKPTDIKTQMAYVITMSRIVVDAVSAQAALFTSDGLKAAVEYATAAGTIVENIGKGADAFAAFSKARFTTNVTTNLQVFGRIVEQAISMLAQYDHELDAGVASANSIAAKINQIVATLASASGALAGGGTGGVNANVNVNTAGGGAPSASSVVATARIDSGDMQAFAGTVASAVGNAITAGMNGLVPSAGAL